MKDKGIRSITEILTVEDKVSEFLTSYDDYILPPIQITRCDNKYFAGISVPNEKLEAAKEKLLLFFERCDKYVFDENDDNISCTCVDFENIRVAIPVTSLYDQDCIVKNITLIPSTSLSYDNGTYVLPAAENAAKYNASCKVQGDYTMPLKIDFTAKTDNTNIRLWYCNALLILNWEVNKNTLHMRELYTSNLLYFENTGYVTENEFHTITWVIDKEYMSVIVDGEVRLCTCDLSHVAYFKENPQEFHSIFRFDTESGSTIEVKDICITEYKNGSRKTDKDLSNEYVVLAERMKGQNKALSCADELYRSCKIIDTETIDLARLKRTNGLAVRIEEGQYIYRPYPSLQLTNSELVFKEGAGEPFINAKHFSPPVLVEYDIKLIRNSSEGNIMLTYGNTRFITIHLVMKIAKINCIDPVTLKKYEPVNTAISENEYHKIGFLILKNCVTVFVDGKTVLCQTGMDYMLMYENDADFILDMPFGIDTGWGVEASLKSFTIAMQADNFKKFEYIDRIMKQALKKEKDRLDENEKQLAELSNRYVVKSEHQVNVKDINIDALKSDEKLGQLYLYDNDTGYLFLSNDKHHIKSNEKFNESIEISCDIEVPACASVMLGYGNAAAKLNGFFWSRSDMWLPDSKGQWFALENRGRLSTGFNKIKWIVHREFSALVINGELQYCFDHIKFPPYEEAAPVKSL